MMLSDRILNLSESATMAFAAEVIKLKSAGTDIINFSIGEPDMNTPEFIKKAAKNAVDLNMTRYTLTCGIKELREAIAKRLKNDFMIESSPDEILVANGAKQAIYNIVMSIINPGDEVVIPAPFWPSHPEVVKLAGGKPVFVECKQENNFRLQAEQVKGIVTDKTKALLISNPNNPTGMILERSDLRELISLCKKQNIYILCDEIYAPLIYDNADFASLGIFRKEMDDRVIVFHGVSKAYAMTGWRIGYAIGNKEIIKAAEKIQSHCTSNACTVSQYAALKALTGDQECIKKMAQVFNQRRKKVIEILSGVDQLDFSEPLGGFYFFLNIEAFLDNEDKNDGICNSNDMAIYLLKNKHIAFVPGIGFGVEGYLRLSYATSMENIVEGLSRFKDALLHLN